MQYNADHVERAVTALATYVGIDDPLINQLVSKKCLDNQDEGDGLKNPSVWPLSLEIRQDNLCQSPIEDEGRIK